MAASCDAGGRVAAVLLSNIVAVCAVLKQHAQQEDDAPTRAKEKERRRKKEGRRDDEAGAAGAGGGAAAAAAKALEKLMRQSATLLQRIVRHECAMVEACALKVALECSADVSSSARGLVEADTAAGERAIEALARRLEDAQVLPCVRRTVAEKVLCALDAGVFDAVLRHGLVSSFEEALQCKEAVSRIERCAHKLAGDFGFSRYKETDGSGNEVNEGVHGGAAPPKHELKLTLTRQAADVIMMDKGMLLGPDRIHVCPSLSCRSIERLVSNFRPCESCPEPVSQIVLIDLGRQAAQEAAQELYVLPQVLRRIEALGPPLPSVSDLSHVAKCLSTAPPPSSLPACLRTHPRFVFLVVDEHKLKRL